MGEKSWTCCCDDDGSGSVVGRAFREGERLPWTPISSTGSPEPSRLSCVHSIPGVMLSVSIMLRVYGFYSSLDARDARGAYSLQRTRENAVEVSLLLLSP
jgi:hypothetical protein